MGKSCGDDPDVPFAGAVVRLEELLGALDGVFLLLERIGEAWGKPCLDPADCAWAKSLPEVAPMKERGAPAVLLLRPDFSMFLLADSILQFVAGTRGGSGVVR